MKYCSILIFIVILFVSFLPQLSSVELSDDYKERNLQRRRRRRPRQRRQRLPTCKVIYVPFQANIDVRVNGNPFCKKYQKRDIGDSMDILFDHSIRGIRLGRRISITQSQSKICTQDIKQRGAYEMQDYRTTKKRNIKKIRRCSHIPHQAQNATCVRSLQCPGLDGKRCCGRFPAQICRCQRGEEVECFRNKKCKKCSRRRRRPTITNTTDYEGRRNLRKTKRTGLYQYRGNGRATICFRGRQTQRFYRSRRAVFGRRLLPFIQRRSSAYLTKMMDLLFNEDENHCLYDRTPRISVQLKFTGRYRAPRCSNNRKRPRARGRRRRRRQSY